MTMNNDNYWKDQYRQFWDAASVKEKAFKAIIENETGTELEPFGLGATSSDYLSGNAAMYGKEKGAPDFKIKGCNIFIEITGPFLNTVRPESGLWIRPDKLDYAERHMDDADEFFALYFPSITDWVIVRTDRVFFERKMWMAQRGNGYKILNPLIRGVRETYVEIPYSDPAVHDLQYLIDYINQVNQYCGEE